MSCEVKETDSGKNIGRVWEGGGKSLIEICHDLHSCFVVHVNAEMVVNKLVTTLPNSTS